MQTYRRGVTRTLGILWGIYGVLLVLGVAFILLEESVLTLMWGALLNRVPNPFVWMSAFHVFLLATVVMGVIAAIFSFLAAVALLQGMTAARRLGLIASTFGLLSSPPGIALGAFTVAILLPETDSRAARS